jgi:uncharacterized protein YycO
MVKIFFADSNKIGSIFIRTVTWSDFSHVGFIHDGMVIDSQLFSGGVTSYDVAELVHHYPRIQVYEFPHVSAEAITYACEQLGKKYDLTALIGMGFQRNWQEDDKWFCSELVAASCAAAGTPIINKSTWRVTPQDVWECITPGCVPSYQSQ